MSLITIELDAGGWNTSSDFRSALKTAIGAPEWHGDMVAAFLDSIFGGGMNALKPPFIIRGVNTTNLAPEIKETIRDFALAMEDTRIRRLARTGSNVEARLELAD
ncbi:hypothetical protein ACNJYA_02740 [Bradyrhizobium sp. DASA03068]|uniref:hypothetical protein n=1 Tax=Bradyrhizobium sp. BLXBL-01 TaxID=3395915 RepID=UPI003F72F2A5